MYIDQGFANRGSQYSISSRNAPTSIVREPGLPAADRRMGAEFDDGDYSDYYYYDDYAQEHKDTNQSNHEPLHDFKGSSLIPYLMLDVCHYVPPG